MAGKYTCKARNPEDPEGEWVEVFFPSDFVLGLYKHVPVQFENLRAAKFVLENAECIFWGLREYNPGGWCYSGRPGQWYIRERITAPFPKHLVFAVYMNARRHVYECRAERAEEDNSSYPIDWRNRFGGLTWSIS
jgi:hypothetical protein